MRKYEFAVPTVIAVIAVVVAVRAMGVGPSLADQGYTVESAPTPYSTSHAIVQTRPGPAEEQPPTF